MLVVISPFYISIVYALKNKNDLTINRLAWPTHPTLMNFQRVITENDQFLTGYENSILTTVPVVVLLMLITSMQLMCWHDIRPGYINGSILFLYPVC